jgi:hypothetical protein
MLDAYLQGLGVSLLGTVHGGERKKFQGVLQKALKQIEIETCRSFQSTKRGLSNLEGLQTARGRS